jgi:hypothetical protein
MRELFKLLISSTELSNEEKVDIMRTLTSAIVSEIYPIEENGLYLRVTDTEDLDKMDIALWYNHKDEDGNRSVRDITHDKGEILATLHKKYLEKQDNNEKGVHK